MPGKNDRYGLSNIDSHGTEDEHPQEIRFAEFRFYEELNDFLPAKQRKTNFRSPFCVSLPHRQYRAYTSLLNY
jgi:hypothetical protein